MVESLSYAQLLEGLPGGGFDGDARPEFGTASPSELFVPPTLNIVDRSEGAQVTLISARGATGKSMLAKQVSADKTVPLWSLDADLGVSAHALEAKLSHYIGPHEPLRRFTANSQAFVVIDALDEARMRVSGLSWNEYIRSLSAVATSWPPRFDGCIRQEA